MENKAHAFAAGAFVLGLLALLVVLALWLTRDSGRRNLYEMTTSQTIPGLQPQAAVRYRGVPVGKVELIGFDTKVPGNVLVRISVNKSTPLTRSTFATITSQGVTGLGFVQLDDDGTSREPLPPNDRDPPRIPLRPGLIEKLVKQSETILSQFEQASTSLNKLLSPANQSTVTEAVQQIGQAAGSLNKLVKSAEPAAAALPSVVRQTGQTLRSAQEAAQGLNAVAGQLNQTAQRINAPGGPLDKLAEGGEALSVTVQTIGASTLPKLNEVAEESNRTLRQLRRTVNAVDDNPQSLIFGNGPTPPGPGEAGFKTPALK